MNFKNPTQALTALVVIICSLKLLMDGVSITIFGHSFIAGHTDPLAYGSILTPVLGAHGFVNRNFRTTGTNPQIDSPDA